MAIEQYRLGHDALHTQMIARLTGSSVFLAAMFAIYNTSLAGNVRRAAAV
jgi:hypothetical protein